MFTCSSGWIKNDEKLHKYVENNISEWVFPEDIPKRTKIRIISELVITGNPSFIKSPDTDLIYDIPTDASGVFTKSDQYYWTFKSGLIQKGWVHFWVDTAWNCSDHANKCIQNLITEQVKMDTPKYTLLRYMPVCIDIRDTIGNKIIELYFHGQ